MYVLGISCFYHDAAASLIQDGRFIAAAQEERFSRKKHDFGFPQHAIEFCLKQAGITIDNVDLVVFYDKPFRKFDRILTSAIAMWPESCVSFREATLVWLLDKLWTRDIIQERTGCSRDKIAFCQHHVAHACSAYYPSGFDKAALLTVDGVGEWSCGSRGTAWGLNVDVAEEMRYPHSIGLLYSAFTAFLGFQVNEGEYKVMGMAPYGEPTFVDDIFENIVELHEDGSFKLNMDYFSYHWSSTRSFSTKFVEMFGRPRTKEESNLLDPHYANVAASIQRVTEIILLQQTKHLHDKYGHENLCMAGGSALNSVANAKIFREAGFKNIYIQPAAGDDGGSLGAALWGYYSVLGGKERHKMTNVYWGAQYSDAEVEEFLKSQNREYTKYESDDKLFQDVVARLTHGQVVGWMQGRFEWGPRALGNRSILADPRFSQMKDVVNARIKFREPFRPFAPSVLVDATEEFFDLPQAESVDPARFMLMVVPVKDEAKARVPAITHVDGTARIQAVHRQDNPRYYDLIKAFGQETGVPVVLNTSFNLRGEPIVNTPAEAYSTFMRSDMDALVMGHVVVSRREVDDKRQLSATELEKWAHTPDSAKPSQPAASVAQTEAAKIHRKYLEEMEKAQNVGSLSTTGYVLQWLLVALCLVCLLEIFLRLLVPITNMQMRGLYCLNDQDYVAVTPNWSGRIHSDEFDITIATDEQGRRPMPELASANGNAELSDHGFGRKVLALGDSFTFGCWSEPENIFLNNIQSLTQAKVINVSQPNAGTDTELRLLRDPDLANEHPDVVMLCFYTGNDFADNTIGETSYTVKKGALVMTPEAEAKWADYDCLTGQVVPQSYHGWRPDFLRLLYTYQMYSAWRYSDAKILRPTCAQAWFLHRYTPEMEQGVSKTFQYLEQIKALAESQGSKFCLVIIPSAQEVYEQDFTQWLNANGRRAEDFDTAKPRHLIAEWAEKQGVPALDLQPALCGQRRMYYNRDMHWNDWGHFVAGNAVRRFLIKNNCLDYEPNEQGE